MENRRYYYKMSLVREMENHVSCRVLENEPMSQHTTFRVGGPARYFVYISNTVELVKILELATANNLPLFVLGSGSNLLVSDSGYDGIVVVLDGDFREIAIKEKNIVAGAGVSLPALVRQAAEAGCSGLEFAVGIPGTLGGAVRGNAGGRRGDFFSCLESIELYDKKGDKRTFVKQDISFKYRSITIPVDGIIVRATLSVHREDVPSIKQRVDEIWDARRLSQPFGDLSAGCIFRNPDKAYAGELIDHAGLKGERVGGAEVSLAHANFIINRGTATARDIWRLIQYIRAVIKDRFGYNLELEIVTLGNFD